jgi:hypothetical protein
MADGQVVRHKAGLQLLVFVVAKPGLIEADVSIGDQIIENSHHAIASAHSQQLYLPQGEGALQEAAMECPTGRRGEAAALPQRVPVLRMQRDHFREHGARFG